MTTTPTAPSNCALDVALDTLGSTVQEYADAAKRLEVATRRRDEAIRAAVRAGQPATDVAQRAGVSRARVYQVLAGGVTTDA